MKKTAAIMIAMILVLTVVSGCGEGTAPASSAPPEPSGSTAPPAAQSPSGTSSQTEQKELRGGHELPLAPEMTTITVLSKMHPLSAEVSEMNFVKQLEQDTNVCLEGGFISSTAWEEKKNITLASGDLPDMFLSGLTKADVVNYGSQGLFLPLQELIEQHAPNLRDLYSRRNGYQAESVAPDGNQYYIKGINELPFRESGTNIFINTAWLEKLGMQKPSTYDEYYEVLKAFKEKDPNGNGIADEIPLTFITDGGNDYNCYYNMFGGWGYPVGKNMLTLNSQNKVVFAPMEEHFADALRYFNKLYSEGLIDLEVFTQNTSQLNAKGKNEITILDSYLDWFGDPVVGAERFEAEYDVLEPMEGPYARLWERVSGFGSGGTAVITNACKDPELAMKWIDYCIDPEISMQLSRGPIGEVLELGSDGLYHSKTPPGGMSDDEFRLQYAPAEAFNWALTAETLEKIQLPLSFDRKIKKFFPANKPYLPENFLPDLMYSKEESDSLAIYKADIEPYTLKMIAQFITGQSSIEAEYDAFQEQLRKMRVDDYIVIIQGSYDRFLSAS